MNKVGKLEFKLNYYFELYKDKSFHNAKEFKTYFIKKHGEFPYLSELYMMMDKYQIKKYGQYLVYTYDPFLTKEERFEKLSEIANYQLTVLNRSDEVKQLSIQ